MGGAVSVPAEYKPLCNIGSWKQGDRTGWRMALKAQDLGKEDLRTNFVFYPTLNADAALRLRT